MLVGDHFFDLLRRHGLQRVTGAAAIQDLALVINHRVDLGALRTAVFGLYVVDAVPHLNVRVESEDHWFLPRACPVVPIERLGGGAP